MLTYCHWESTGIDLEYHDTEWGVPVFDDLRQFEFIFLEAMQCGLSWSLILKKREIFRHCFDNFDYEKIARYTAKDIQRILKTEGMIRSPQKIKAMINNAQCFLKIRDKYESFSNYIWSYSDHKTIIYTRPNQEKMPVTNGLAKKICQDLKKQGFKYFGPIVTYSYLEACGIINDHSSDCPRFAEINNLNQTVKLSPDAEVYWCDRSVFA